MDISRAGRVTNLRCAALYGPMTVVELDGDLDLGTCQHLVNVAGSVLSAADTPAVLVLELAKVRVCAADGVRALFQLRDVAVGCGVRLVLRDPRPVVVGVLAITGASDLLHVDVRPGGR